MSISGLRVCACALFQQAYTFKCLVFKWLAAEGVSRPEKSLPQNGNFYAT